MDLISTLSLSDIAMAMIGFLPVVLSLKALWSLLETNPVVAKTVETALVFLNNTKEVWEPAVNASLVVLEPIGRALQALSPFAKDLVVGAFKGALVLLVPIAKALVLVYRALRPLIVIAWNTTASILSTLKDAGMSFSSALATLADNMKDIGRATWTLTKSLGSLLYYGSMGVSYIVNSIEDVGHFFAKALFEPHTLTWQSLSDIAMPFLVVGTLFTLLIWRNWKTTEPEPTPKETKPLRRSERIARKRSFFLSSDANPLFAACKKASARSSNL